MPLTLLRALTGAGKGSRRRMADAIRDGHVFVNGEMVTSFSHPVAPGKDRVEIDGEPVNISPEKKIYLVLNKPRGVLSTTADERGRATVLDILPAKYRGLNLYPVGRLDKDSTGLLVMTNDGELTYRLTHPRFENEKEYLVAVDARLSSEEKRRLEEGVMLEEGKTSPVKVNEVRSVLPHSYSITIHEGKKRQVRRMMESLGHKVLTLERIREGNLRLGSLKEGEVRELGSEEVGKLLGGSTGAGVKAKSRRTARPAERKPIHRRNRR